MPRNYDKQTSHLCSTSSRGFEEYLNKAGAYTWRKRNQNSYRETRYVYFYLITVKELLRYWRYMPYEGRNFNPRTLGKRFYFVICLMSRHWFQTKLLPYNAQFCRFRGENVFFFFFFHFFAIKLTKNGKIFIKHYPRVPKHHLCQTICVNGVLEHGGRCSTD